MDLGAYYWLVSGPHSAPTLVSGQIVSDLVQANIAQENCKSNDKDQHVICTSALRSSISYSILHPNMVVGFGNGDLLEILDLHACMVAYTPIC
jgi:hypothetical protein